MSSFLSMIGAPNSEGTIAVHIPLQVFDPDELDELADAMKKYAKIAREAKAAKDGRPAGINR